ncbi:hypothetical protein SAMN05216360_12914 [Methylobacterium phyllostachyos]|uniref:Uncharacterized protein n=1 Tax=Methylobacterium phyllostachyos TaxID=582672 RepID=A0A1H0KUE6_9HYPH|nr:hypothetical protein [Methylobacterium phyllostachyos]SDO59401.1 hypothetical protein SAMN05216360_12914 [Methylobacterium phyllostachyos]
MTPKLMDRLAQLEAATASPTAGKHLIFRVEAPHGMPGEEIITFLRERGHAIRDGDDVLLMNVGSYRMAEGEAPRDLSAALLTEQERSAAPAAGRWPKGCKRFTFRLESPRALQ